MKYALIGHNIEYSKSKEWFESQGVEYEVFDTYYLNYADDRLVNKEENNKHCSWTVNGLDMLETQARFVLDWWREDV